MEHKYWEERLQSYLDNELAPADVIAMEQHIAQCEECEANLEYFDSLKRRMKAHAETVCIPRAVEERIQAQFSRKRTLVRRARGLGIGLSLAAALVIGFILPTLFEQPYRFEDGVSLVGFLTCFDCEVAEKAGMIKGQLCGDTHALGLRMEDGELWRFSGDSAKDTSLIQQKVRIYGEALHREHIFRVKSLEPLVEKHAWLILSSGR